MTFAAADKLMERVAKMTDAEVLDVLEAARAAGSDTYLIHGLTAEAFARRLILL